jgi:hypothetical protein
MRSNSEFNSTLARIKYCCIGVERTVYTGHIFGAGKHLPQRGNRVCDKGRDRKRRIHVGPPSPGCCRPSVTLGCSCADVRYTSYVARAVVGTSSYLLLRRTQVWDARLERLSVPWLDCATVGSVGSGQGDAVSRMLVMKRWVDRRRSIYACYHGREWARDGDGA